MTLHCMCDHRIIVVLLRLFPSATIRVTYSPCFNDTKDKRRFMTSDTIKRKREETQRFRDYIVILRSCLKQELFLFRFKFDCSSRTSLRRKT